MAHRIVLDAAIERHQIHAATCRARRQGLACSACIELADRAVRAFYAPRYGVCSCCGADDYLIGGLCEPCRVAEAA